MPSKKQHNKGQSGFTILEVIVAIFIFSILAVLIGGIFAQALKLERRTLAAQKIQENTLRVFEMMAREIRVSQISSVEAGCYESLSMNSPFADVAWDSVTYALSSGKVTRQGELLTSADIVFNSLKFCVRGSKADDLEPARVTIAANVQANIDNNHTVDVQTTVTSRDVRDDFQN